MKGWHYAKSDEERHQRILASAARFRGQVACYVANEIEEIVK